MPPKRNQNKEKLEKQRKKLAKMKEEREKKMNKLMEQMAATREKAERDLEKFRKMELQIEMDKNKKKNKKFNDLKVASSIAQALNRKDKGDDDFANDVIALLQELEPMKEEDEEEGISIGMLESALRKGKKKSRKENKNLLMKGKLKVWGDSPPNGLKLDSLLRRHTRGGRRTRKKKGGGTTSPIPGLKDFVDRVSPPTIVDRFVVLREHYQDRHNIFLNTIFNDIWANKNRTLFNKLKKKAGTNDETVINLMKHEFTIANSMLMQHMDRLVNDFRDSVARDPPHKKYIFRQTTLIDCFDTAKNRDYIGRLLDNFTSNHILFFLYVLKFLQIVVGNNRSDTKLNKDGDYEIDPIDNFALLAITISYYRLYRTIQRRDVPQVYDDVCNTILQIHKDDLINKRFIGWQKGGRKKTRKRRKKRKNRKKTRK